jgi:hypothetical protein
MKTHLRVLLVIVIAAISLQAQQKHPDLDGVWQGPYTPDLSLSLPAGETIPFTPYGAERFHKIDTAGHEHSAKLRLTETFEKTGPNTIHYTVTFGDPTFFTRPWTSVREFKRQNTRIMSYSCEENEKDRIHLQPRVN